NARALCDFEDVRNGIVLHRAEIIASSFSLRLNGAAVTVLQTFTLKLNQPRQHSFLGGESMMSKGSLAALASALLLIAAFVQPAAAQVTTASVSGTVKDLQGGVIPGATLTLISETQGTQTTDVFTNEYGDFVFANIKPDRYTVQVAMDG